MGIYNSKFGIVVATLRLTRDGTEYGADPDLSRRIGYLTESSDMVDSTASKCFNFGNISQVNIV